VTVYHLHRRPLRISQDISKLGDSSFSKSTHVCRSVFHNPVRIFFPHCPIWDNGRVSTCLQRTYLSGLLTIGTCSVSLIISAVVLIHSRLTQSTDHKFAWLAGTEECADATPENFNEPAAFVTTMSYVVSNGRRISVLEPVILLADIAVCAVLLVHGGDSTSVDLAPVPVTICSSYFLFLAFSRMAVGTARPQSFTLLCTQSSTPYVVHWLFSFIIAHAVLIDPPSAVWRCSILAHAALFTLLVLSILTAPRELIDPDIEHETHREFKPAKEPRASLLSHVTFSWVGSGV
jgi:hypothetical protein